MWFIYRKSPLGIVAKESMKVILGVYSSIDKAREVADSLGNFLQPNLSIVELKMENINRLASLDPDMVDVIKQQKCLERECYILIGTWSTE
ncbi:MAG: hypothetical protein QXT53_03970 [Ignisphaera sp.]